MQDFNDSSFLEQAKTTANYINNGIMIVSDKGDGQYQVHFMNRFMSKELGYTQAEAEQLLKNGAMVPIFETDIPRIKRAFEATLKGKKASETYRLVTKDNKAVWFLAHFYKVSFYGNECVAINYTNVEDLIGLQKQLESDNDKWLDIIDSIPIGIAIFSIKDEKNTTIAINKTLLQLANEMGSQLDGKHRDWSMEEMKMILNQSIYAFCVTEDQPLVREMLADSEHNSSTDTIFRLMGSNEKNAVYVYSTCVSKPIENGRMYYVTFQNVTADQNREFELREKQEMLYKLSYYDALTGVKNRNAFNAFTEVCKTKAIHDVGIAFCDLNGLKKTNDTLGHSYGDQMLVSFVDILKQHFQEENIYRISGDEFVIIIANIDKSEFSQMMTEVNESIKRANNIASVGFVWKQNVSDIKRRISQAEQIMYVEKQKYYEESVTVSSKHRPLLLERLMADLDSGLFRMYLQPKSNINEKKARGAEALVRKFDSNGNVVPPYEFIPQLEKERLIPKIDFFMLEEVCKFLEQLKQIGNNEFVVSVNMSRVTLVENDYIERVSEICNKYDFNRNQLEFEITESNETMDHIRMEEYIKRIKSLGIGVSIDDAGTEYSSLPMFILDGIDWVKFDRSLVVQLNNEKARKLVSHLIIMSHDMNMRVIAEGVESDDERALLESMQCDMYQGYYLSKPVPVEEFKQKFL